MSYTHFTLEERKYLQESLAAGLSIRKIADYLGRSPSSVSREIHRNCSKRNKKGTVNRFHYHHWRANALAVIRRKKLDGHYAIKEGTPLWDYIIEKLSRYWSPEQIVRKWREEHSESKIGISTIYRYLKDKRFPGISSGNNLRRRGKKRTPKNNSYNTIHPDRLVLDWTDEIVNRKRVGDWEGDTVFGGVGKGSLVTLVDRKTRYLVAGLIYKRDAETTRAEITRLLKKVPVSSLTFDNGPEFAEFKAIEKDLSTLVYFAEPHKPWQRGTNENTNDILRFFFPKGFDFRTITQSDVDEVVSLINERPRKCLNWISAEEAFQKCCT